MNSRMLRASLRGKSHTCSPAPCSARVEPLSCPFPKLPAHPSPWLFPRPLLSSTTLLPAYTFFSEVQLSKQVFRQPVGVWIHLCLLPAVSEEKIVWIKIFSTTMRSIHLGSRANLQSRQPFDRPKLPSQDRHWTPTQGDGPLASCPLFLTLLMGIHPGDLLCNISLRFGLHGDPSSSLQDHSPFSPWICRAP
jgi:hypothetical protein